MPHDNKERKDEPWDPADEPGIRQLIDTCFRIESQVGEDLPHPRRPPFWIILGFSREGGIHRATVAGENRGGAERCAMDLKKRWRCEQVVLYHEKSPFVHWIV